MDEGKEQLDYVGPGKGLGFFWHRVNFGTCIPARLDSPPRLKDQAGNCVASPLMSSPLSGELRAAVLTSLLVASLASMEGDGSSVFAVGEDPGLGSKARLNSLH